MEEKQQLLDIPFSELISEKSKLKEKYIIENDADYEKRLFIKKNDLTSTNLIADLIKKKNLILDEAKNIRGNLEFEHMRNENDPSLKSYNMKKHLSKASWYKFCFSTGTCLGALIIICLMVILILIPEIKGNYHVTNIIEHIAKKEWLLKIWASITLFINFMFAKSLIEALLEKPMMKWIEAKFFEKYDSGTYNILLTSYLYKKYNKKGDNHYNEELLNELAASDFNRKMYEYNSKFSEQKWDEEKELNFMHDIFKKIIERN